MQAMNNEIYGKVQPGKKALIIYATIHGNTEKIAMVFEKVLLHYGFEVDVVKATDPKNHVQITGYALYLVGSGIVGGIPERNLLGAFGAGNYTNMRATAEIGGDIGAPQFGRGVDCAKGIMFFTYGGNRRGPTEMMAADAMIEMMMVDMSITCVGKFACGGFTQKKEMNGGHYVSDLVARAFDMSVEDLAPMLKAYAKGVDSPEFLEVREDIRNAIIKAADEAPAFDKKIIGMPRSYHNMAIDRPSERDLLKAEIFLSEIVEDLFIPDETPTIYSPYLSIC